MFAEGFITMRSDIGNAMTAIKHAPPLLLPRLAKVISRRGVALCEVDFDRQFI